MLLQRKSLVSGSTCNVGPYDLRDVENVDRIVESSHKMKMKV